MLVNSEVEYSWFNLEEAMCIMCIQVIKFSYLIIKLVFYYPCDSVGLDRVMQTQRGKTKH